MDAGGSVEESSKYRWHIVYPTATLGQMKDVGLRIRIDRDLREKFLRACKAEDRPAAQVIREFMRAYVEDKDRDKTKKRINDS